MSSNRKPCGGHLRRCPRPAASSAPFPRHYDTAKWTTMDGTIEKLHLLVRILGLLDVKDPKEGRRMGARGHRAKGLIKVA